MKILLEDRKVRSFILQVQIYPIGKNCIFLISNKGKSHLLTLYYSSFKTGNENHLNVKLKISYVTTAHFSLVCPRPRAVVCDPAIVLQSLTPTQLNLPESRSH